MSTPFRPSSDALFGDGRDEAGALNAPMADLRAHGGGRYELPPGAYSIGSALDIRGTSNLDLYGQGIDATTLVALPTFDGLDQHLRNNVIHGVNGLPPDGATDGHGDTSYFYLDQFNRQRIAAKRDRFYRNIRIRDLTIVCTASGPGATPTSAGYGFDLAGIHVSDADHVEIERVRLVDCYGNGIVVAPLSPEPATAPVGTKIRDCIIENCVRGVLPTYGGVTGSVIQVQARRGVIERNLIRRSGGPAIDVFGSFGVDILRNDIEGTNGVQGTLPNGRGQFVASIRSDGGYDGGDISDNRLVSAGSILLLPLPVPLYHNAWTPWHGPRGARVQGNRVYGLAAENVAAGYRQAPTLVGFAGNDVANLDGNVTRDNMLTT